MSPGEDTAAATDPCQVCGRRRMLAQPVSSLPPSLGGPALADPKGGQSMPWHTLSGPLRPTQEHAIGLLLPSPSKRRHADAAEKKRETRTPTPSRHHAPPPRPPVRPWLSSARRRPAAQPRRSPEGWTPARRASRQSPPRHRGPKTCELLACHRRRPVPAGDHPRGQKVDY